MNKPRESRSRKLKRKAGREDKERQRKRKREREGRTGCLIGAAYTMYVFLAAKQWKSILHMLGYF